MSGLTETVSRTHDWTALTVEGELPAALRGTMIRTGPGVLERFGRRLSHTFEADGVLSGLRLDGSGAAFGAVQIVQSEGYLEEEAAGKALYGSAAPRWRRIANGLRGRGKTTGNTSVLHWQGRMFALMEGGPPLEIDASTLKTGDEARLGGVISGAFSAHPHRVDAAKTTFGFGQVWGSKPGLDLYAMPDDGPARALGRVPMPWNAMVHDFAVTSRHAVFVICPAKLRLVPALLGGDFDEYFRWDPSASAQLLIVPLDAPDRPIRVDVDARWVFHLANAYERAGELVVDWVQYPDFAVFTALSGSDPEAAVGGSRVQRLVVDLQTGTLRSDEPLWDHPCDFPVLPETSVGEAYSSCWYAIEERDFAGGVARLDVESGAVDKWEPGPGHLASEALFVPQPDAARPDQGWLLSLVYDGWRTQSYVAVLDASRPSEGPLAKVWMGQGLPLTFHGTFVAA